MLENTCTSWSRWFPGGSKRATRRCKVCTTCSWYMYYSDLFTKPKKNCSSRCFPGSYQTRQYLVRPCGGILLEVRTWPDRYKDNLQKKMLWRVDWRPWHLVCQWSHARWRPVSPDLQQRLLGVHSRQRATISVDVRLCRHFVDLCMKEMQTVVLPAGQSGCLVHVQ